MKKSIALLFFLWASVSFGAPALCSGNGATYDSLAFCESQCGESCTELISSGGTCSSSYKNFVYDNSTNTTYALTQNEGAWTSFQSSAIVRSAEVNTLLKHIVSYSGTSSAWIGLYDPDKTQNLGSTSDTRFRWRDGSLLNYRNWASGQPDNAVNGGDIGNVAVYGEHWVLMDIEGTWSDTGEHSGQPMNHPALVEFAGQLNCVKGTVPSDETDPEDIITTYCEANPDKCNLCTDSVDIYQCTAGTSGGYLCPKEQAVCNAQYAGSTCPAGGVLNTQTDKCEATRTIACPNGMTYDSNLDRCTMPVMCPYSGILNGSTDLCEAVQSGSSCPTNYTFDTSQNLCVKDPECSSGTYKTTTDRCEFAATYSCPANYTYNSTTATCEAAPICQSGTAYNTVQNKCLASAVLGCPSGYYPDYDYDGNDVCATTPICTYGSYNGSYNRCQMTLGYSCSLNAQSYSTSSACSTACSSTVAPTGTAPVYETVTTAPTYLWTGCARSSSFYYSTKGGFQITANDGCDSATVTYYGPGGVVYSPANVVLTKGSSAVVTSGGKSITIYLSGSAVTNYNPYNPNMAYFFLTSSDSSIDWSNATYSGYLYTTNYVEGCPDGFTYYPDYHICKKDIIISGGYSCPDGYTLSGTTCVKSGTCSTTSSCPTGTTKSGSYCISTPNCPSGGTVVDGACQIEFTYTCPTGTTYDQSLYMCVSSPTCADSGVLNTTTDKCSMTVTSSCPNGYTRAGSVCYSSPICSSGIYNAALDRCVLAAVSTCPTDYTLNSTTGKCEKIPTCSIGTYSTTINMCAQLPTINCNSGYTYNSSNILCESQPSCSSGTYDVTQNSCLTGHSCPYSGQPCVEISGNWLCSKYGCYDAKDQSNYSEDDTTEGENDIIADGEKDDEGNCLGSIYIFNGNDRRCRVPGVQTGFTDCCKKKKDWFGLAKCNPTEQLLSSLRSWGKVDGQCREIGEYCSSKFLGICIQKKKTYCCFGSPLSRIIQEQGRPQLDISWGSPKTPNCRGFTPDEFQKLDFSKISFDEWVNEYVVPELNENITNNIKETFENITLPTGISQ